jgi:hypothetical protein
LTLDWSPVQSSVDSPLAPGDKPLGFITRVATNDERLIGDFKAADWLSTHDWECGRTGCRGTCPRFQIMKVRVNSITVVPC